MAIPDKRKTERADELTESLRGKVPTRKLSGVVDVLVENEYRKERHGTWMRDVSFENKKFVRWICSECNHWQSAQRHIISEQIFYMNYCPFCGAQMEKPEREDL